MAKRARKTDLRQGERLGAAGAPTAAPSWLPALALALAGISSTPLAAAEHWVTVAAASDNIRFAIDRDSIERDGQRVRFLERMIYLRPEVRDEASARRIKEKRVGRLMDCDKRTQAVLFGSTHADDGSFITSTTFERPEGTMTDIPSGSVAEAELNFVCGTPRGTLFGIDY